MKFSTRENLDIPADELFDRASDFQRLERVLSHRGAQLTRIDPATDPGTGIGWNIGFDLRGKPRQVRMDVVSFNRPEGYTMRGASDLFDIEIVVTVIGFSAQKSRLMVEMEVKPRNMRARLIMQTARLGKAQLDKKYAARISEFVRGA